MSEPTKLQKVLNWYTTTGKPLLQEVPVVSSLFRDGLKTSEGALMATLAGLLGREAFKEAPNPWVLGALSLGMLGVGVYAHARGNLKAAVVAAEADANAGPDPVEGFLGGSN